MVGRFMQAKQDLVKIQPVTVNNSGFLNLYSAMQWATMMYITGKQGITCKSFKAYDLHPISYARNMAVQEFLQDPSATHLFFLDSDVVPS